MHHFHSRFTIGLRRQARPALVGIDTPEMKESAPRNAPWRSRPRPLNNTLESGQGISVEFVARDKYFRVLALIIADGLDLADAMVEVGLARNYKLGHQDRMVHTGPVSWRCMRQFTEEMTPVKIVERGKLDDSDTHWRVCTVGGDDAYRFTVSITGAVAQSLAKPPHEYDIDDIAIIFVEMAFEHGHKAGEFSVTAESSEYAHLVAYLQKLE